MNFKRYHESKNMFDKNNTVDGYRIGGDGGLFEDSMCVASDFIAVEANTAYTQNLLFTYNNAIAEYDNSMGFIVRYVSGTGTFITSQNTKYIRICSAKSNVDTLMLNEGSTALPYQPYKDWTNITHYIHNTSTGTITTLPVDIYADGNNATVGLKGNTVQNGTPTPDNPIMPQSCGERTENLFDKDNVVVGGIDADGSIAPNDNMRVSDYIRVNPNTVYTATYLTIAYYGRTIAYYDTNKNIISTASNNVQSEDGTATYTITTPNNCYYVRIATNIRVTNHVDDIMFNLGSTPLPYQPYGYKIPILSANTTTTVYLGEVESTRQIKKLTITGNEGWKTASSDNTKHYLDVISPDYLRADNQITYMSSHYNAFGQTTSATSVPNNSMAMSSAASQRLYIADANYTTDKSFIQYLTQQYANGTPVTVWYVLAAPTTGIVNEPLRKIGEYVDTVGGISIPTITGADSFDVLTTLKPSEVELTYTGWHDATVKEWDGSQWS